MKNEKRIGGGLQPLPEDPKRFKLGAIFGQIDINEVPTTDFVVAEPLIIKDQFDSDLCTAFSVTAISEDQEGVELSPEFMFMLSKRMEGDYRKWGMDLQTPCHVAVKSGFLEQSRSPFTLASDGRDKVANPENWESYKGLEIFAKKHLKHSYFEVDGDYDTFDNIRAAMWQHRAEKRSIMAGCMWRSAWTYAEKGVISKDYGKGLFGHAFKLYGQKIIDGELYIMAQLSNGTDIGDEGIFYFPREVVNKEFTWGLFMFKDMPPEEAKYLIDNGLKANDNWLKSFWVIIKNLFTFKK